jgi:hypothetical protein
MEAISKAGAEAIRTASRVRQWAILGSKANITQFGLQRYLRDGRIDPTTERYLEEGCILFLLLQEGEEVTNKGKITAAHQLAAVNALEPIRPQGEAPILDAAEITKIVETIKAILERKHPERSLVEESLDNALRVGDAYTDFAFKELEAKEKAYIKPNAVRV